MGTFAIHEAIDIAAPPRDIWAHVIEHDEWRRPVVVSVRALDDADLAVGSRYENKVRVMGITATVVNEITVLDPPNRLAWKQVNEDRVKTQEGNYILAESGTGTTFSIRGTYVTSGMTAPPAPLARWLTGRILRRRLLPQLKAAVER